MARPARGQVSNRTARFLVGLSFVGCGAAAHASEGPWTTAPGLHNLYAGAFYERFECFTLADGEDAACPSGSVPVDAPVQRSGVKLFYRTGLGAKLDVAVAGTGVRAFSAADGDAFETNTGFGVLQARVRRGMGAFGPVDLSASLGAESGALHRSTRGQITNLGDGVHAALATVSAGAAGLLGPGFYTASADVGYALRVPEETGRDPGRLPADELRVSSVMLYGLSDRLGVGASVDGQFRLWGEQLDFGALQAYGDASDSLRWAALDASQVKVGARLALYPTGKLPYLQLSAHRAVWAQNNPVDTTLLEVATGFDLGTRKEGR